MWGCWFMAGGRAAFAEWRIGGKMEFYTLRMGNIYGLNVEKSGLKITSGF